LDETWRLEKRAALESEKDDLHKRWFALAATDWISRQMRVDEEYTLVRHGIHETLTWILFEQEASCPTGDVHAKIWSDLTINIETAAVMTLIGDLNDLANFKSYVTFRNRGMIEVDMNFLVDAELRFTTGPKEIFGIAPLGASFQIPGIATIGPQFRMITELNGRATLNAYVLTTFHRVPVIFLQTLTLMSSVMPKLASKSPRGT
jgi:chitinase